MNAFSNILFLDIETVSQKKSYSELDDKMKMLWDKKAERIGHDEETSDPQAIYKRAAIYAEFGKIVCISVGIFDNNDNFCLKSFCDHDEKALLTEFAAALTRFEEIWKKKDLFETRTLPYGPNAQLCAHNGKEFDFPFIARRMIINGIPIPKMLQVAGKKPWETSFLDTMELWKFGDYKNYTSLDLLCTILDIPTPKDDINGSEVGEVYWQDDDLKRIQTYCQKDVIAVAQIMCRYNYMSLIPDDKIVIK